MPKKSSGLMFREAKEDNERLTKPTTENHEEVSELAKPHDQEEEASNSQLAKRARQSGPLSAGVQRELLSQLPDNSRRKAMIARFKQAEMQQSQPETAQATPSDQKDQDKKPTDDANAQLKPENLKTGTNTEGELIAWGDIPGLPGPGDLRLPSPEDLLVMILRASEQQLLDFIQRIGKEAMNNLIEAMLNTFSRHLSEDEIYEGHTVFGSSIPFHQIRLTENNGLVQAVAKLRHFDGLAVTTGHFINISTSVHGEHGNNDMMWLMHELTHVWQFHQKGWRYAAECIYAQTPMGGGYVYGHSLNYNDNENAKVLQPYRGLGSFNNEQQAVIIEHYYMRHCHGLDVSAWQPYANEVR